MLIANEGRQIVVGEVEYATAVHSLKIHHRIGLLVLVTQGLPMVVLWFVFPDTLSDPLSITGTLVTTIGAAFAVLLSRFLLTSITGQDDVLVAIFDRDDVTIEIVFNGLFGLTRKSIPFDDVSAIRRSRGEWDGEKVQDLTVVKLLSGQSIQLPELLSVKDLNLLKTLTGLRQ